MYLSFVARITGRYLSGNWVVRHIDRNYLALIQADCYLTYHRANGQEIETKKKKKKKQNNTKGFLYPLVKGALIT